MRSVLAKLDRAAWLHAGWSVFGLLLMTLTWPLWWPGGGYPAVPLIASDWLPPAWIDVVALLACLLSLAVVAVAQVWRVMNTRPPNVVGRVGLLVFLFAIAWLMLTNQHRLQPWAVQWILIAYILLAVPREAIWRWLRWLTASIYAWSAVAKLDHEFLHTQGQQFLFALAGMIGLDAADWSEGWRVGLAWVFPLAELLLAAAFLTPWLHERRRRWFVVAAAGLMHGLLILALSPFGLGHKPAVLAWNLWFIVQAWLLLAQPAVRGTKNSPAAADSPWWRELGEVVNEYVLIGVMFLPALNLIGRLDHWLAWGLYAPRNSRVTMYVHTSAADKLPEAIQWHLFHSTSGNEEERQWLRLRLDLWSLAETGAPIYPSERFQLAVAVEVVRRHQLDGDFQAVVEAPPDRSTGVRRKTVLTSIPQLQQAQAAYWFNAKAR